MKRFFGVLLSPLAFATGFLWPLVSQTLVASGLLTAGWGAIALGAVLALPLGVMAQLRGSWVWIR